MTKTKNALLAVAAILLSPIAANAAFILIDDSDVDSITISVNDFEGCFSVNGVELSCGLGNPQSLTLDDGVVHSFEASWIDLGLTVANSDVRLFGISGTLFSGIEFNTSTDGFFGSISGAFVGFDRLVSFGAGCLVCGPQDGSSRDFSQPFLSASYISEVPAPGTLALLGLGLIGFGAARKRKA